MRRMLRSWTCLQSFGCSVALLAGCLGALAPSRAVAASDFTEVYEIILKNLPGVTARELDEAALRGLLGGLEGKAYLAPDGSPGAPPGGPLVAGSRVFYSEFGYVRVGEVGRGLDEALAKAVRELAATNQVRGLVLDLRSAAGQDYLAAADAADLFITGEKPLLEWDGKMRQSQSQTNDLTLPLMVLVNRNTRGAAEALGGILRQAHAGFLIGTNTSGTAYASKGFALRSGRELRIAEAPILLGDRQRIATEGLKPDVTVEVDAALEAAFVEDPFGSESGQLIAMLRGSESGRAGPNPANPTRARPRMTEAELVRMLRQAPGGPPPGPGPDGAAAKSAATPPAVRDPVLARALDLLKGVILVQRVKPL